MINPNSPINESTYLTGKLLGQAIFEFGPAELIQEYSIQPKITHFGNSKGFLGLLQEATSQIQAFQHKQGRQDEIITILKSNILELIQKADLIPIGYKSPRDLKDMPEQIPADFFFSGEIDWNNSELKFKNWEFTGIRLLKDLNAILNLKAENSELNEIPKLEKPKKPNMSELDPDLHIDEIHAGEFLGLSPRTLQGYRVKGGGPEFRKIGKKTVRYKIADLISWSENNKKKNTSQY